MSALKDIATLEASLLLSGGADAFSYMPKRKGIRVSKDYENKNGNIEYYTDEKGNIRRRKKK